MTNKENLETKKFWKIRAGGGEKGLRKFHIV
jgi:hypothetical protein